MICLEENDATSLTLHSHSQHNFHKTCLLLWVISSRKFLCPLCGSAYNPLELTPSSNDHELIIYAALVSGSIEFFKTLDFRLLSQNSKNFAFIAALSLRKFYRYQAGRDLLEYILKSGADVKSFSQLTATRSWILFDRFAA